MAGAFVLAGVVGSRPCIGYCPNANQQTVETHIQLPDLGIQDPNPNSSFLRDLPEVARDSQGHVAPSLPSKPAQIAPILQIEGGQFTWNGAWSLAAASLQPTAIPTGCWLTERPVAGVCTADDPKGR